MVKVIAINIGLILLVIAGFNIFSYFYETKTVHLNTVGTSHLEYLTHQVVPYSEPDPIMGFRPKSNITGREQAYLGDKLIYDVEYKYDSHHKRITPSQGSTEEQFALFFGGSHTHGDGVSEGETLPAQFIKLTGKYKAYNFGFQGYGPQHMFIYLGDQGLKHQVSEKQGIALYIYFSFHKARLIGAISNMMWTKGNYPWVGWDENKHMKNFGLFKDTRKLYTWVILNLSKIPYFRNRVNDFPDIFSESSNQQFCDVLLESKQKFQKTFPKGHFILAIAPESLDQDPVVEQCLEPQNISYVDLRNRWDGIDTRAYKILPGKDEHLNALGYQAVTKLLVEELQKKSLLD